jgi:hypothetical protein
MRKRTARAQTGHGPLASCPGTTPAMRAALCAPAGRSHPELAGILSCPRRRLVKSQTLGSGSINARCRTGAYLAHAAGHLSTSDIAFVRILTAGPGRMRLRSGRCGWAGAALGAQRLPGACRWLWLGMWSRLRELQRQASLHLQAPGRAGPHGRPGRASPRAGQVVPAQSWRSASDEREHVSLLERRTWIVCRDITN